MATDWQYVEAIVKSGNLLKIKALTCNRSAARTIARNGLGWALMEGNTEVADWLNQNGFNMGSHLLGHSMNNLESIKWVTTHVPACDFHEITWARGPNYKECIQFARANRHRYNDCSAEELFLRAPYGSKGSEKALEYLLELGEQVSAECIAETATSADLMGDKGLAVFLRAKLMA